MRESVTALAAAAGLLIVSVAFGQQETSQANKYQGDARVYADLAKAPEKARAKRNPFETDTEAVAAGRNLFEQHCAECHGKAADGSKKAPSLRAEEVQDAAPGAIFWILTNGVVRRGMPVWSKLPAPQRWQLVTFIKSLGPPSTSSIDRNHHESLGGCRELGAIDR